MALVVADVAEVMMLKYILNHTSATNVKLRLYSNNITPAESDLLSTYLESTASGYAAISLTGSSWSVSTTAGTTTATYADQTFTFSGSATVYGYYVTDSTNTYLLWAERFTAAPITLPGGGGSIVISPSIALG